MSAIHTSVVTDAHAYTRVDQPWIIEDGAHAVYGRLVHYLSGGGMTTFGRTLSQEIARTKHRRFYVVFGVLSVLWLLFLIF